jgi:glycosyltransferase involved in cell wall biosynthesis
LRVGIDIRALKGIRTGIGRYLETLLPELFRLNREINYVLFYNSLKGPNPPYKSAGDNSTIIRTRYPNKALNVLWAYTGYPRFETLAGDIDVFYSPNFQIPPLRKAPGVLTIHDLVFYHSPELAIPSAVRHYRRRIKFYSDRADIIIGDSLATVNDISRYLGIPREKTRVIYPGAIPLATVSDRERNEIKKEMRLPEKYILFVGCIEPRKNLARAFRAYERTGLWKDIPLVLAGPRGWRFNELKTAWDNLTAKNQIFWLDYVGEKELAVLYENAFFLIFPSLFEGFGLPILEAMSAGCPVLTSNCSSMPEAAGDAALYVDPLDTESIADGMLKLAGDGSLRESLISAGYKRAKLFTWEKTARELLDVFYRTRDSK